MENKWHFYLDRSYYDMWAVAPVDNKNFLSKDLFHLASREEAERLCALLNKKTKVKVVKYESDFDWCGH